MHMMHGTIVGCRVDRIHPHALLLQAGCRMTTQICSPLDVSISFIRVQGMTHLLDISSLNFLHPPRNVPIASFESPTSPVVLEKVCEMIVGTRFMVCRVPLTHGHQLRSWSCRPSHRPRHF